ncbi:unnamed protein product [Ilex paraguariensis]|uniref:Uncharacterized protein n=1 Tax=Ilex paraguariensis TaxID=185542 RepID=A0ABC8T6G9_9AQUA
MDLDEGWRERQPLAMASEKGPIRPPNLGGALSRRRKLPNDHLLCSLRMTTSLLLGSVKI